MITNPTTLQHQILNLAEVIGKNVKEIRDGMVIDADAYERFMEFYNGITINPDLKNIEFDSQPTEGSDNFISSGAVYEAINTQNNKLDIDPSSYFDDLVQE